MRQTVVGVFEEQDAARAAVSTLEDEHFDRSRVHAIETSSIPILNDIVTLPDTQDGVMGHLRHLFTEMFGARHDVSLYEGIMRRGSAVVSVDVDNQPQAVRAELAFVKAGAIDVTRRTPFD